MGVMTGTLRLQHEGEKRDGKKSFGKRHMRKSAINEYGLGEAEEREGNTTAD